MQKHARFSFGVRLSYGVAAGERKPPASGAINYPLFGYFAH
ncbi:hypothetical protein MPC1_660002 [Methylocella tundrae]|nr:hypothetical protein MPC1_660002 [Methylocella tundrae]